LGGGVGHLLAGVAVIVSNIPWWVQVGFFAAIILSLVQFGYGYGYPHGRRFIRRIEWLDERWQLATGDGRRYSGQLISGYAYPYVVIVNFRLENGQHRSLTLLPDSADVDELRRMRVWLRTRLDS